MPQTFVDRSGPCLRQSSNKAGLRCPRPNPHRPQSLTGSRVDVGNRQTPLSAQRLGISAGYSRPIDFYLSDNRPVTEVSERPRALDQDLVLDQAVTANEKGRPVHDVNLATSLSLQDDAVTRQRRHSEHAQAKPTSSVKTGKRESHLRPSVETTIRGTAFLTFLEVEETKHGAPDSVEPHSMSRGDPHPSDLSPISSRLKMLSTLRRKAITRRSEFRVTLDDDCIEHLSEA